ncbi:MAG TPA: hypothetical protein VFU26_10725 [Gaiellaceae bacterium]|nr:hypothetical protein [Gaiellaceae bacterium]
MGLAAHIPGDRTRFGLSATAASATLYTAVVLFGVGSAVPSALDAPEDRGSAVVPVPPHDSAVPGPARRLPQVSPGPPRHRSVAQAPGLKRLGTAAGTSAPRTVTPAEAPPPPSKTPAPAAPSRTPPPPPADEPTVEVTTTLPAAPDVTAELPEAPALPLPLPLPAVPALPALPAPSDLPG